MFRLSRCARTFAFGLLMTLLSFSYASAHCYVGARFFPATLATDDPCVADEMSLPTVAWSKTGDIPAGTEVDISVEISKRITEDFGVSIGDTWSQIRQPGNPTLAGFGNLETAVVQLDQRAFGVMRHCDEIEVEVDEEGRKALHWCD